MIKHVKPFTGFSEGLFQFLKNLTQNNNTEWFRTNKKSYQKFLVEPAKSFITEITPFINRLNPSIRTEPKVNKTILRMNKDMRFNKGEPYRNYFLIHFGKFKMDSEFFLYFEENEIQIGLFINNSNRKKFLFNQNISEFRQEIIRSFTEFKVNNRYSLYELNNNPIKIKTAFNADKHFSKMESLKFILLQKVGTPENMNVFSPEFLIETVNIFTLLYPIYIFSISSNPLKEIEKFKSEFSFI